MQSEMRTSRLAVLIDADNTSAKIVDGLFDEIAKIGEASVRRIYGDFASTRLKSWSDTLSRHAILPQQQFAHVAGKNASDIALVIDAMDLLHSGRFDGFCLVSSDSDFTRLAVRIREQGLDVYGFGEKKTVEDFRKACNRFIYTENLRSDGNSIKAPKKEPKKAVPDLKRAIEQMATEDGWVSLAPLGSYLVKLKSDFDTRTYGYAKLSDLVRDSGAFDISKPQNGQIRIRAK